MLKIIKLLPMATQKVDIINIKQLQFKIEDQVSDQVDMELEDKITEFFFFSKFGVTQLSLFFFFSKSLNFRFQELYREKYREKY